MEIFHVILHDCIMTDTAIFNPQQILTGERLELRPVSAEDFEILYNAASDPGIWAQHPQYDRYKQNVFKDYFDSALTSQAAFVICDKNTGEAIGSSRFENPDFKQGSVEIGWTFLARSHWGGSYNAELKDIMLKFAFSTFQNVHFCIGEDNQRSRTAVQKLGAELSDMLDESRPGHVFYVLTEDSYLGQNNYGRAP